MSIPYVIILSDSDEEDEPMLDANVPSDPDNESNDSNAWEEDSSEEEDPSEDEIVPEDPPQSPVHMTYDTSGPHTIRTPGKSVAQSRQRMAPSSDTTTPSTDPYLASRVWNYLPTTLHEWRKEEKIPTITEIGESSTARQNFPFTQEPPHHTIPLLVTRAIRHEDRLDHIEDAILEIPGADVLGNVQFQMGCLDNNIKSVRDATEDLKQRAIHRDIGIAALEGRMLARMDALENRVRNILRDFTASIMKEGHIPKK